MLSILFFVCYNWKGTKNKLLPYTYNLDINEFVNPNRERNEEAETLLALIL